MILIKKTTTKSGIVTTNTSKPMGLKWNKESPNIYYTMKYDNSTIRKDTKIDWCGEVKIAKIDICDLIENNPDEAPRLWVSE